MLSKLLNILSAKINQMINSKRGAELTFNTIIIAVISLVVLVVIISIFRGQITDIAKGFKSIREKETDETAIKGMFGCNEGETACRENAVYICQNSEWVKQKDCSNKCSNGACV